MIHNELISIIIPVYNAERYLDKNIRSIISQTYNNLEIIYVCDGCTDASVNILKGYSDSRIQVIENNVNRGAASARNVGLRVANGEWVIFWDADDEAIQDAIQVMYESACTYNSDLVICRFDNINTDYKTRQDSLWKLIEKNRTYPVIGTNEYSIFDLKNGNEPYTRLIKRELLIKNDITFQNIQNCNDVYFSYASIRVCSKISYVNKVLYLYNNTKGNLSSKRICEKSYILDALDAIYELGKQDDNFIEQYSEYVKNEILAYRGTNVYDSLIAEYNGTYKSKWNVQLKLELEYLFEYPYVERVTGKRLVLFGAGQVGQDYHKQLCDIANIVGWIDNNWMVHKDGGVLPVSAIKEMEYDYIIIAINSEGHANNMRKQLIEMGIDSDRICT